MGSLHSHCHEPLKLYEAGWLPLTALPYTHVILFSTRDRQSEAERQERMKQDAGSTPKTKSLSCFSHNLKTCHHKSVHFHWKQLVSSCNSLSNFLRSSSAIHDCEKTWQVLMNTLQMSQCGTVIVSENGQACLRAGALCIALVKSAWSSSTAGRLDVDAALRQTSFNARCPDWSCGRLDCSESWRVFSNCSGTVWRVCTKFACASSTYIRLYLNEYPSPLGLETTLMIRAWIVAATSFVLQP